MPHARSFRTISATLGTAALVALLSLSVSPAVAADAPWSAPVEVADAYGTAGATVVAPDGTITVASETATGIVAASSTDAGVTWTDVAMATSGDYTFRPAVGVTSTGLLAVTWVQELSGTRTILVSVSSDKGATFSTPVTLPTVDSYVDDPVVGSSTGNGFTIVWNEGFTKLSSVSTDGGATWSAPAVISQNLNSFSRASLSSSGTNQIVVIFQEFEGITARYSMQSRASSDGGATWGTKVAVGSDWSGSFGNGLYQYVVSPSAGTLVAVWGRGTADGEGLFATTSTDGGATWAPQFSVGTEAGSLRYFTVQVTSPTTAGIVWHSSTQDAASLYYATVAVGAAETSAPVTIATSADFGFDYLPAFSALGDVRVASWYDYTTADTTAGYRASVSCDAGATWSAPAVIAAGEDVYDTDAQTSVSGTTFAAYWGQATSGPSEQSLYTSTITDPCGSAVPPGPSLAATGAPIAQTGLLALVIVALGAGFVGAGFVVVRRRAQA